MPHWDFWIADSTEFGYAGQRLHYDISINSVSAYTLIFSFIHSFWPFLRFLILSSVQLPLWFFSSIQLPLTLWFFINPASVERNVILIVSLQCAFPLSVVSPSAAEEAAVCYGPSHYEIPFWSIDFSCFELKLSYKYIGGFVLVRDFCPGVLSVGFSSEVFCRGEIVRSPSLICLCSVVSIV